LKLKDIIQIGQTSNVGIGVSNIVSARSAWSSKTKTKFKSKLKLRNDLKTVLKEDNVLENKQATSMKSDVALKSQLKSLLDFKKVSPSLNDLVMPRQPRIRDTKTPKQRPFAFGSFGAMKSKKKGGKNRQFGFEEAYLPDFTSRSLGLEAEVLTQKQAQKRLKTLLTGLEIRRGVKVR
jgi:hypothetical protein